VSARPLGSPEGDWRVELLNGTVLIGPLQGGEIEFVLPHGPDALTVPLERFVAMERQYWTPPVEQTDAVTLGWPGASEPAPAVSPAEVTLPPAPVDAGSDGSGSGWFDNGRLYRQKQDLAMPEPQVGAPSAPAIDTAAP
jgi:hypothetical protein